MAKHGRLRIKQVWGTNAPSFWWELTSNRSIADAIERGNFSGVDFYRQKERAIEEDDLDIGAHPLGASSRIVFDVAPNLKSSWTDYINSGAYFNEFPDYFAHEVMTLGHTSSEPGNYISNSKIIEADTAHTLRFLLADTGGDEEIAEWFTADWGIGDKHWQFILSTHATALAGRASTWTQENESLLFALLLVKTPTEEQQEQIEELRAGLYTDYTTFSLKGDKIGDSGTFYEVTFYPERAGYVSVYQGKEFVATLKCGRILRTRQDGDLWPESHLNVQRSAGHFFWQAGYPEFATNSLIVYPYKVAAAADDIQFIYVRSVEAGVTSVVASDHAIEGDDVNAELHISFTSTNPRKTAWLYGCMAWAPGSERNGSSTVQLDTDDLPSSVIRDATPQCEGDLHRTQWTVKVGDVDGSTFQNFPLYSTGEHRTADWEIDGTRLVTDGIVMLSTAFNLRKGTPNLPRLNIAKGESEADLVVCDKMCLLEEYILGEGEIVGDGRYLEELLLQGLRAIGEKEANLVRIPGHDMNDVFTWTTLRPLPAAIAGEKWAIKSCKGASLLDFLTTLFERFGMGATFSCARDGLWDIGWWSTAIKTIGGVPANFLSTSVGHDADNYPGRLRSLGTVDMPRDIGEFYNIYQVEGADPYTGEPLVWIEHIEESMNLGTANRPDQRYIGRARPHPPVCDTSLRTLDDVIWVCRSLQRRKGKPPRYVAFPTYLHEELVINDHITFDGIEYEAVRTPTGSMARDSSNVLFQEVWKRGGYG